VQPTNFSCNGGKSLVSEHDSGIFVLPDWAYTVGEPLRSAMPKASLCGEAYREALEALLRCLAPLRAFG
jgi:hypothetical protein